MLQQLDRYEDVTGLLVGERHAHALAFSPSGALLATGTSHGVVLWDVAQRQRLGDVIMPEVYVWPQIVFATDTMLAFSGASSSSSSVFVWDTRRKQLIGRPLPQPTKANESVKKLTFAPDHRRLATLTDAGYVSLWDIPAGVAVTRWDAVAGGEVLTVLTDAIVPTATSSRPGSRRPIRRCRGRAPPLLAS